MVVLEQAVTSISLRNSLFTSQHHSSKPTVPSRIQYPNHFVFSVPSIYLRSSKQSNTKWNGRLKCAMYDYKDQFYGNNHYNEVQVAYPKPSEIPWKKELCNSVNLIGIVAAPIEIKHLPSGKVVAWTRLAVKKNATQTSWYFIRVTRILGSFLLLAILCRTETSFFFSCHFWTLVTLGIPH